MSDSGFESNSDVGIEDSQAEQFEVSKMEQLEIEQIEDSEVAQIKAIFHEFDADGSGGIDAGDEILAALTAAGLAVDPGQCDYMMRKYDDDRNGYLCVDEFVEMVLDIRACTADGVQKRLELRTHNAVQKALGAWWDAAVKMIEKEEGAPPNRSTLAQASLSCARLRQPIYVAIMCKLFKAMSYEYSMGWMDEAEVVDLAQNEWESDRRGKVWRPRLSASGPGFARRRRIRAHHWTCGVSSGLPQRRALRRWHL